MVSAYTQYGHLPRVLKAFMKKIWEIYGIREAINIQAAIFGGYYPEGDRFEMAEQYICEQLKLSDGKEA